MAVSLQDKVAGMVSDIAENHGMHVVKESIASNVGKWLFQKPGSLKTYLSVNYNFQPGQSSFESDPSIFSDRPVPNRIVCTSDSDWESFIVSIENELDNGD